MVFQSEWIIYLIVFMIVFISIFIINGYRNGFLLSLCDLFTTVICIIVSNIIANYFKYTLMLIPGDLFTFLPEQIRLDLLSDINYVLIFIISYFLLKLLFGLIRPLFKWINDIPFLGFFNKVLGILTGLLQSLLFLCILTLVFSSNLVLNGNYVLKETKLIYLKEFTNMIMSNISDSYVPISSNEDEYSNIKDFLYTYDFSEEEINEVINLIEKRSE